MMTSTRMRRRTENRRRIHSNGFFAELDTSVSLFVVWFANWTRCMRHWLYSLSRPQETFSALFQRTVAAVLQSVGSKLEIMAFIHALASLAVVWTMHVQFVANSSCEPVIASLLRNCSGVDGSKADIMQVQVVGELFKSTFHNENMSPSKCTFWRYEEMNVASASPEWHTFPLAKKGIVEEFLENILLRPTVLRYSSEKGLLLLNQNSWPNYNISFATLEIDLSNPCFGNWFLRKLVLETFVGYDTILLNAVAHYFQYRGYILHMLTGQVINLDVLFDVNISKLETCWYRKIFSWIARKGNVLVTSIFIMGITGTLVTFALREVRSRVVKLTLELQQLRSRQTSITGLLLRYSLEGAVFVPIITGMLFFLLEFFDDYLLAFLVLVLAWVCELFCLISRRHWVSRYYLPRLFFIYFLAFHIYFFSYPCGFSKEALYVCAAFMQHAVLVAWNRWEGPFLREEHV
ncbi:hypothetical protein GAYE_SCF55G6321 [Galdieria yellowstonensis]|uniref:Uncharacterized protein n=1 Tax=Galdieria yellowstonensis TaxID=3028027 RepID=A0AAV9ILU4_9RHOD|nr:hypothetical protein GAYE_SCF55G6321 [Galdieria yellowstonensis]